MLVTCEKCYSEFNLNEKLVKPEGSKVRCSKCHHIFTVYSSEPEPVQEPILTEEPELPDQMEDSEPDISEQPFSEDLEETVALDSPPVFQEESGGSTDDFEIEDFDKAFEDALESDTIQDIVPGQAGETGEDAGIPAFDEEEEERHSTRKFFEKPAESDEIDEDMVEPSISVSRPKKREKSSFLMIVLIIIVLLGGAAGVYFFAPQYIPESLSFLRPMEQESGIDTGIRRIMFKDVDGKFLESNKVGKLFIIKGIVTNENPQAQAFISIKAVILDDNGVPIRHKVAYAGNYFSDNELVQMSVDEIDKGLRNRAGKGNINTNVMSGKSIPFMIIFENLPENVSEFEVTAVSSSPVNK